MRIELTFELDRPELIKDNKSIWISYLKHVISKCNDGKYYEKFFSGTNPKDYSFCLIFSKPKYVGDKIFLDHNLVKMIFSASDKQKTGLIFYAAFIANKGKRFRLPDENSMILKSIRQVKEKVIIQNRIMIKTVVGGGLVVRDHNKATNKDKYYTVDDHDFVEQANTILSLQAKQAGFSNRISENVKIEPIDCKKVVVKQYGIYIDATKGIFLLEGDKELLKYFYQAGLGSKHSMGYGLIDIVTQDIE